MNMTTKALYKSRKIAVIIDKPTTAIDRLSQGIKKHLPHFDIEIVALHPKRPDVQQISAAQEAVRTCDILHVAYWKSGEKLKEFITKEEWEAKPKILCHYNPYDL